VPVAAVRRGVAPHLFLAASILVEIRVNFPAEPVRAGAHAERDGGHAVDQKAARISRTSSKASAAARPATLPQRLAIARSASGDRG
jgi:hypothetical protein